MGHDRLELGITREAQDRFALASHQRAIAAIDSGKFKQEILPVPIPQRKGESVLFETDERPRRDTSLEALSRLQPAFKTNGTVTAGNSSGLNDGSAALLIMREEKAKALGIKPMARVVSMGAAGVPPRTMGLGPIPATGKALHRAGLTIEDIQLVEINEAFAVQTLAVMDELGLGHEITNVNGGGVALQGGSCPTTFIRPGDPVCRCGTGRKHHHRMDWVGCFYSRTRFPHQARWQSNPESVQPC